MQFCPCSHPFAIFLKILFYYFVTLTTSAVPSVIFHIILSSFYVPSNKKHLHFLSFPLPVPALSSLIPHWETGCHLSSGSDFHLQHPLPTKIQKQLHPLCHCVLCCRKEHTLNISKVSCSPSILCTKISFLIQKWPALESSMPGASVPSIATTLLRVPTPLATISVSSVCSGLVRAHFFPA